MNKHILIIAGEISADLFASALVKEIKKLNQKIQIISIGGKKLQQESDIFLYYSVNKHSFGYTERIFKKPFLKLLFKSIKTYSQKTKIDLAIICDFGDYNHKTALFLKKNNIPIITYITPNFWILNNIKKAQQLINLNQKIITIFPKEQKFYQSLTSKAYFFGHPLTQLITPSPYPHKKYKTIALFPGSRTQEIKKILPKLLQTVHIIHTKNPNYKFNLAISSPEFTSQIKHQIKINKQEYINLINNNQTNIYQDSNLVICASGTTSLEAFLAKRPVIVLAGISSISYFIAKKILKLNIPYISLPNIIAQQPLIPEFIQTNMIPSEIAKTALSILNSPIQNWEKKFLLIKKLITKEKEPIHATAQFINNYITSHLSKFLK